MTTLPAPEPLAPKPSNTQSYVVGAAIIVAIVALYVGSGIFVPLVLAVLLSFALAPVVRALHKLHLPHVAAVLLSVLGAALVIGFIAFLIVTQLVRLAGDLPQYQQVVAAKIRAVQESTTSGDMFEGLARAVEQFSHSTGAAAPATDGAPATLPAQPTQQPIPVTIADQRASPLNYAGGILASLLGPLTTAAIVSVFVIFLLLEREDFRDRFLKLVSRGDLRTSTMVINEAGKRVSRYLLIQFGVNVTYGIIFGTGLFFIGIPNPILWGLFAGLFRYIPFVGTLIAASIPFALAFAVDPGWGMLLKAVALYVALELTITNAVEPRLYGTSTGLSALAVIVAAMFWATLWGPIGLILATPLTVCLVVLGRYVPQLRFLEILLGSEPVLVREEQLYQRLLSGNTEEAIDLAERHLNEGTAVSFYDDIAVPALRLAEADRARNLTDLSARRAVVDGMAAVVREVRHFSDNGEPANTEIGPATSVLCIGGRTELDGAAADMVAQVLERPGITARTLPPISVRQEGITQIDLSDTDVVCLVYLGQDPRTVARFAASRLKRRKPSLRVLVCLLHAELSDLAEEMKNRPEIDAVALSLNAAEAQIALWHAEDRPEAAADATPALSAEDRSRLLRLSRESWASELTGRIAADLSAPVALIAVLPDPAAETLDAASDPQAIAKPTILPLAHVVATDDKPLVVSDIAEHADYAAEPFLLESSIHAFAGVPLIAPSGETVGALFVLDDKVREFTPEELQRIERWAGDVNRELIHRLQRSAALEAVA